LKDQCKKLEVDLCIFKDVRRKRIAGTPVSQSVLKGLRVDIVMFFSSLDYDKKKLKFFKGQQNGEEIQDGSQTRICQKSVNFFSKLQNGGQIQDRRIDHCLILCTLSQLIIHCF
jgi:hypothetical protein